MPAATRLSDDRVDSILLEKLLANATVREAAAAAGVDESTARRHFRLKPELGAALREARRNSLDRAIDMAAEYAVGAVKSLGTLATEAESEQVRLNAARGFVALLPDLVKLLELDERLSSLEDGMAAARNGAGA